MLLPLYFLGVSFLFLCANSSSGVVIKSGVVNSQGQAQNENSHDVKLHKGIANFEGEEGFNKDDESNSVVAQDTGRYGEQSANKKAHLDSNNFQNENFRQNAGDEQGNVDKKVAHHKGHHKSGFSNSYHKDESGSNSSYFDDGSDEGGQIEQKNYKASFGDAEQQKQDAGKYDRSEIANEQARRGLYDNSGKSERDHGARRNYNRNNYYDNREDLDSRNLGNNYKGGARYAEEKYAERAPFYPHQPLPYYHDDQYRRPLPPPLLPQKHHITIYEDPRYVVHSDPRYRRSEDYVDDFVELDVRSPVDRDPHVRFYEDRRPDYYYDL